MDNSKKEAERGPSGREVGGQIIRLKVRVNIIMDVFHLVSALCIRVVSWDHALFDSDEGAFFLWGLDVVGEGIQVSWHNPPTIMA